MPFIWVRVSTKCRSLAGYHTWKCPSIIQTQMCTWSHPGTWRMSTQAWKEYATSQLCRWMTYTECATRPWFTRTVSLLWQTRFFVYRLRALSRRSHTQWHARNTQSAGKSEDCTHLTFRNSFKPVQIHFGLVVSACILMVSNICLREERIWYVQQVDRWARGRRTVFTCRSPQVIYCSIHQLTIWHTQPAQDGFIRTDRLFVPFFLVPPWRHISGGRRYRCNVSISKMCSEKAKCVKCSDCWPDARWKTLLLFCQLQESEFHRQSSGQTPPECYNYICGAWESS